ncbi:bifunctional 3-demethylubiquinone-9 3-methyltransferase/ 2-octaprenyl-6-hydroxy phenol methylase [compost metagenome]
MSDYYWDKQIEYLNSTRCLYYNDDYLEFLVKGVWGIERPVSLVDYGCGYGYLGLKLLPLLPKGSRYTGIDKGKDLIAKAREIFAELDYETEFIEASVEDIRPKRRYDIAVCHAFLLHMADVEDVLGRMVDSVVNQGMVICFEPHWIGNISNYGLEGTPQSKIANLGILQRLYENDAQRTGKDGNIGLRLPILLSELGLSRVECRVSDKVNFLDRRMDPESRSRLFRSLKIEGLGQEPGDYQRTVTQLIARGLSHEEARRQYDAEMLFSREFTEESWLTYAPNMKITFGTVERPCDED